MNISFIFINDAGRLRSGLRLAIFSALFLTIFLASEIVVGKVVYTLLGDRTKAFWAHGWSAAIDGALTLSLAIATSWFCCRFLEGLPFRAVGWSFVSGWAKDLLIGSVAGGASLLLAALVVTLTGGFHFSLGGGSASSILTTVLLSLCAFVLLGASEEALFRGYPLQTMTRANLAWVSIVLTAALFAEEHMDNPHVVAGFTFVNTALAGVWLALAYLKTRNLWFPLGLHWSWNWMMGAILGLPVSGISRITPNPIFHALPSGPNWLTGGSYGIEGGAACTLALIISGLWIWRTRLLKPAPEMLELSSHENASSDGLQFSTAERIPLPHVTDQQ